MQRLDLKVLAQSIDTSALDNLNTFKTLPDHSLLEALPCCVLLQRGGSIVYCNRAARGLIGLSDDSPVDRPVSEVFLGAYPGLKLFQEGFVADNDSDPELDSEIADRPSGSATRASFECALVGAGGSLIPICGSYVVLNSSEVMILIAALPLASQEGNSQRSTFLEELLDS